MVIRPNVVIITCHDLGRHLGCYGVSTVQTPSIDRMAEDGVLFSNYFTVSPVCSPSRGTMLTGRYPQSNGLMGLTHAPWSWALNEGERHLSHLMSEAGYRTMLFGIQHETSNADSLGFQEMYAQRQGAGLPRSCQEVAGEVVGFLRINKEADRPFYAQIGFFETHRPFNFAGVEPDDSHGVYIPPYILDNEESRAQFAQLQGDVRSVDAAVQSIQEALRETGQERDTLFVFTADHGIEFPRAKWYCYDPGIEIALIMRWPGGGLEGGKRCESLLSNIDFLPTLLDLIDVSAPRNLDGTSFKALIPGQEADDTSAAPQKAVFSIFEGGLTMVHPTVSRAVRTEHYKLIRHFWPARKHEVPVNIANPELKQKMPVVQLFDLDKDPNEFCNVADDPAYAGILSELSGQLWAWLERVDDPILKGPTPTPYYQEAIADYIKK
ncbi:sulfatase [Paenibacillus filicis]|uniref:Sulfatase n=1 Tax=Paenibacillus gyeongsangnamensis TaxID=3388067 RepID=A0ABT4QAU4_9BACL|nr:sulfatase [Paenibacillus filicis]MCZ8513877.1 sulfatase [Paenibacillus filicis]